MRDKQAKPICLMGCCKGSQQDGVAAKQLYARDCSCSSYVAWASKVLLHSTAIDD